MTALSPERVGRITGSRVAGILGLSPYKDRAGVMREMVRERLGAPTEFTGNIATEWGNENEPTATAEYEQYRGEMVHSDQLFSVHRTLDYLGCTPDGLVGLHGMVQVKCPYRAKYSSAEERPDIYEQMQFELEVMDREWSDLVVWRPNSLAVSRVGRDPSWLHRRIDDLDAFIAEYEAIIYDPDLHRPYLDEVEQVPVRDDFEWQIAALEYVEAKAAADRAKAAKEAARDELIRLAAGRDARGGGVSVTHADRDASEYTVKRAARSAAPTVRIAS